MNQTPEINLTVETKETWLEECSTDDTTVKTDESLTKAGTKSETTEPILC